MIERKQAATRSKTGARGPAAKGGRRREAIVAAAMQRFAQDGYQNASIASIAEDVELSQPGLLHHFPTKVDLLLAVLEQRDLESTGVMDGTAEWRDLLEQMKEAVRHNMEIPGVTKAFALLNAESLTVDHPAQGWFFKRVSNLQANIAVSFKRAVERKEIRDNVNCHAIAAELIALMDGLQMLWLRSPGTTNMASVFSDYVDRLVKDIEADNE